MKRFNELTAADIQSYLSRGWLTHDGMWLFNAYQTVGIEGGNELNLAAIKSMAPMEMKRTMEILGCDRKPSDIMEIAEFLKTALALLLPKELHGEFTVSRSGPSAIRWKWREGACFAYKGIKRIGMLERYRCGVIYRIECWLQALGYKYEMRPSVTDCLMKNGGTCAGEIIIDTTGE